MPKALTSQRRHLNWMPEERDCEYLQHNVFSVGICRRLSESRGLSLIISQMFCNKTHCSCSWSQEHTWLWWKMTSPNLFVPKLGHGKSTRFAQPQKEIIQVPAAPGYVRSQISEGRWESRRWQHVTSAEFELPANVYNWNGFWCHGNQQVLHHGRPTKSLTFWIFELFCRCKNCYTVINLS